ncbi:hypothetical protein [Flavihumibacter sp. ZG627]|uniref:hypothetical protein n=1 Tax=Flavihumibacter sp. ZG627 TaxID=1463156 RepID=UPI00057CD644|nr:hypothetical protein [Flavihumibacter sp. ZG627]KIC90523.1 hypothetical protein HY58_11265 [Flavihumibacter sp. ZG627]
MKTVTLVFQLLVMISNVSIGQTKLIELPWAPREIVVDVSDNLYIEFERMLMKITPDGRSSYVSEDIAKEFRGTVKPDAELMVADSKGNIFMTHPYWHSLWKLAPDGKLSIHAAAEQYQNAWAEAAKKPVELSEIEFMTIDKGDNIFFNSRINHSSTSIFYRLTPENKQVLLKDKGGDTIKIRQVTGLGVDRDGMLYISSVAGRCINKITADGTVTVVAGQCFKRDFCPVYTQGDIAKAELVQPGPTVINSKNELLFADERMNRIIKVSNNSVKTVAGASLIQPCGSNMGGRSKEGYLDGPASKALFNFPSKVRLAIDSKDNLYILDGGNYAVRKLTPAGVVTTIAKTKN